MSLTTIERGLIYGGLIFGWKNALLIWGAYIRGNLYTGGGGLIYGILRYNIDVKMRLSYKKLRFKKKLMKHFSLGKCPLNTAVMG